MGDSISTSRRAGTAVHSAAGIGFRGCAVCEKISRTDQLFFSRQYTDPGNARAAETVADSLGFCPRHARVLAETPALDRGVATAFLGASRRLTSMLETGDEIKDRLARIFFVSPKACPACAFHARAAVLELNRFGKSWIDGERLHSAEATPLCFAHFRNTLLSGAPAATEHLLRAYIDECRSLLRGMAREGEASIGGAALGRAYRFAAGDPITRAAGETAFDRRWNERIEANLSNDDCCPICIEVRREADKWCRMLASTAGNDEDAWFTFPTCPAHLWECAQDHGFKVAHTGARNALDHVLASLYRAAEALAGTEALARESARTNTEIAGRGKEPVGAARAAIRKWRECPACRRLEVARNYAVNRILDLLQQPRHRDAFERGYGLCFKHFALAYTFAPKGEVRGALRALHADRIGKLVADLQAELAATDPDRALRSDAAPAWRRALIRFSGFA